MSKNIVKKVSAVLLIASVLSLLLFLSFPIKQVNAASNHVDGIQPAELDWVKDCGWVTCSIYFSQLTTKWIAENGPLVPGVVALIPEAGPVLAVSASFMVWKADQAKNKGQCLRVRYTRAGPPAGLPVVVGYYSTGDPKFCRY